MSEASVAVGRRVAELLLAEFESAYRGGDFGVIAQDVAVFDKQHFLALLPDVFEQSKGRLRISLVGELDDVATFQSIYPQFAEFVSSEEEMAVRWRNKKSKTIVVVANGPLSKQASLKEFRSLGEHSLITRLCDEQRDKAEVLKLRSLWDALKSPRGAALSLQALVNFATTLRGFSALERSVRAPKALHAVGLFPDSLLAEEQTEGRLVKRLRWNADTLNMVSNATPEDWDRMATFCRYLPGKEKARFNGIRKRLKALNQSGAGELDLKEIELADVLVLWKGKVPSSAQAAHRVAGPPMARELPSRRALRTCCWMATGVNSWPTSLNVCQSSPAKLRTVRASATTSRWLEAKARPTRHPQRTSRWSASTRTSSRWPGRARPLPSGVA